MKKDAVFLDSSLTNDLGRYSLIGLVPYHTVSVEQGQLQVDGKLMKEGLKRISKPI